MRKALATETAVQVFAAPDQYTSSLSAAGVWAKQLSKKGMIIHLSEGKSAFASTSHNLIKKSFVLISHTDNVATFSDNSANVDSMFGIWSPEGFQVTTM